MHMSMTGSNGILSVPSEHVPGLIALVATPLVLWALVVLVGRASGRGRPWAQRLDRRLRDLPFAGKVAAVAMVVGATVHAAIVPTHWGDDQVLAILFVVDALGFLVASWWTVTGRRHWPSASAAMLGGTVAGYAFYLVRGWETPDPVGMLTSTVELAGFFVVVLAGHSSFADPERRRRMLAASVGGALAILLGTVVATGSASGASASAAPTPSGGSPSAMGSMTHAGLGFGVRHPDHHARYGRWVRRDGRDHDAHATGDGVHGIHRLGERRQPLDHRAVRHAVHGRPGAGRRGRPGRKRKLRHERHG